MRDRDARQAALIATLVAVPSAVLAALLALWLAGAGGPGTDAGPSARPSTARHDSPAVSASVSAPAPRLGKSDAVACRGLMARLPDVLRGQPQRPVTAGAEQNAAYGRPAILLRCGVAPPSVAPTATVYPLSGVCWLPEKSKNGTVWTTLDRRTPVSVTTPRAIDEPGQWVAALSGHVAKLPEGDDAPSGCHK